MTTLGSVLMHISERKHQLPGLLFHNYASLLLNMDRFTAIASTLFMIILLYPKFFDICSTSEFRITTSVALSSLYCSENILINNWNWYAFWHGTWHLLIFYMMGY